MKISIVIPVYNEADSLSACLNSIMLQKKRPHEVIVVDNNSTDDSAAIALKYDFVKLVSEPKQGVVHARTRGFNEASGELIARLDADTILPNDWLSNVTEVFSESDVSAVSGVALYYDVAASSIFNSVDLFLRRRLSLKMKNTTFLWAANMAMRRSDWLRVRDRLCYKGNMHEDYDLAIHLQEIGASVAFDERLKANVSSRRVESDYLSFMRYAMRCPDTYTQHGLKVKRHFYPVILICAIGYLPGRILHQGYDYETERFSLYKLLEPNKNTPRVDPSTYVA